jgi:predicted DNA-binding protein YlxM (UPF0122 family)
LIWGCCTRDQKISDVAKFCYLCGTPRLKTEIHNFPTRKEKTLDSPLAFVYDNTGNRNQVIDMEKIVRQGLLYDFYGELLTEHQRHVYEDVVFHDFSLSEIAQEQGISRQGVHDLIKRCDRILAGYEQKLKLVEKFRRTQKMAGEIQGLLDEYTKKKEPDLLTRARVLAGKIGEE